MKYSKFFEDELTLENLSRPQLQAMCRVLDLQPMGMDGFLRFSLRMKLKRLKMDDVVSSFSILSFSFLMKSIFKVNWVQGISIVNVNIHTCFY